MQEIESIMLQTFQTKWIESPHCVPLFRTSFVVSTLPPRLAITLQRAQSARTRVGARTEAV